MTTPDPQAAKPPPGILAQPAGPKLKVKDGLEPAYANLARISHSPTEFVVDFGHMIPGEPTAKHQRARGDDAAQRETAPARAELKTLARLRSRIWRDQNSQR
jgi:hypothetical protein